MIEVESQNLWLQALDSLPSEQRKLLGAQRHETQEFSGQKLLDAVESSQRLASANSRTILTPRGPIVVKEKLDSIAQWIRRFIAIGDSAMQFDPGHAALPWAAFRLVLQVFLNDGERASEFATGMEQVAFLIYDCAVRETLYLDGTIKGVDDLRRHFVSLYREMLRFLTQALVFFQSGTAKRLLHSVSHSGRDVLALLQPISRHTAQILTTCGRIDAERQLDVRNSVSKLVENNENSVNWLRRSLDDNQDMMRAFLKAHHQETLDRLDQIDTNLRTLLDKSLNHTKQIPLPLRRAVSVVTALSAFRGKYANYDRIKVLEWLSRIPYVQHHKQTYGEMLTGTGTWFFEQQPFQDWRYSINSAMLWFHGAAGRGKTKIMSLTVEKAIIQAPETPYPLFFYCSRAPAEPERARTGEILRCLVKQITLRHEEEEGRFPRYVVKEYSDAERMGFVVNHLSPSKCCEIIAKYAKDHGHLFVCIDAVDECSTAERYELFAAFQSIITLASTVSVKILVSSRDDVDVETFLPGNAIFEVNIDDDLNRDDIAAYVEAQVSLLIQQRRISIKGKPPTDELQSLITQKLCDGAQGMFRWVSLQLEYLCTLRTAGDIKQRLGRLPKELTRSYDELYNRKLDLYDEEDKDRLEFALTMMLWAQQPIDMLFAQLVFFDPQEDEVASNSSDKDDASNEPSGNLENTPFHGPDEEKNSLLRETIRLCFNFIVHDSTTSVFRFAHTSVQDYLQTHRTEYTAMDRNFARLAEHFLRFLVRPDLPICHKFVANPPSKVQGDNQNESNVDTNAVASLDSSRTTSQAHQYIHMKGPNIGKGSRITTAGVVFFLEGHLALFLNEGGPKIQNTSPIPELLEQLVDSGSKAEWSEVRPFLFLEACKYAIMPLVSSWLEAHPALLQIQETYPLRGSPLLKAAQGGHEDVIEYLLGRGASAQTYNFGGWTILAFSTSLGLVKTMKDLIARGADVEGRKDGPITTSLIMANGEPFVDPFPQVDKADNYGLTPLCLAASYGRVEAVRILINSKANIHAMSAFGPPISLSQWVAEENEGKKCTQMLLDAGANVNALNYWGATPLVMAACKNYFDRLQILLDAGADLEIRMTDGLTAVTYACNQTIQPSDCIKALLDAGADLNVLNWVGAGPLAVAARNGNLDMLNFIIPHLRDVNTQDWEGDTPLTEAMVGNQTEAIKILLAAGAEITPSAPGPHSPCLPNEERIAHYGRDAILRAAECNRMDMAKLLIDIGNQQEPEGQYAEAANLLGDEDEEALERWIEKRRETSPRIGDQFGKMETRMYDLVPETEYNSFEKIITAAGRKMLYYKHPFRF